MTYRSVLGAAIGASMLVVPAVTTQAATLDFNVGYINYVAGYGVALFDAPNGKPIGDRKLAHGSSWKVTGQTTDNGQTWYNLGGNQWVSGQYLKSTPPLPETPLNTVGTVNYVPGYSIAIWDSYRSDHQFTGKKLAHGTSWRVYKQVINNGVPWYNLGGNQWIDGTYFRLQAANQIGQRADTLLSQEGFSGMALAYQNGQIVFQQAYGQASANTDNTPTTLYPVYSMQKQFTAAIIQQLVASGQLSYAQTMDKFYPGLPNAKQVTVRNLITHTSGYGNGASSGKVLDETSSIQWVTNHIKSIGSIGTYNYQDGNYTILAGIIAQITKSSYATQLNQRILQPLGLHGVISNTLPSGAANLYTGNYRPEQVPSVLLSELVGAGNLWLDANSIYQFEKSLDGTLLTHAQFLDMSQTPAGSIYAAGMWHPTAGVRRVHGAVSLSGGNSDAYYWGSLNGQSGVILVGNKTDQLSGDPTTQALYQYLN